MTLDTAFAACIDAFAEHPIPTHLCCQCYDAPREQQIIGAARAIHAGKMPTPHEYGQIYFEHPDCSGGVDTIKLFTPFGLRELLTGQTEIVEDRFTCYEVIEKMVQSGFWWWPLDQQATVREVALCLFWDWFEDGHYAWPVSDRVKKGTLGPGDDILTLCTLCLIDPYDLVRVLSGLHKVQADAALAGPLNFSVSECTYVAKDTSTGSTIYQDATATIAETLKTREALAFCTYITQDWVEQAFFRSDTRSPGVAKELSEFGNYYDIRMLKTYEAVKVPELVTWPALDLIR